MLTKENMFLTKVFDSDLEVCASWCVVLRLCLYSCDKMVNCVLAVEKNCITATVQILYLLNCTHFYNIDPKTFTQNCNHYLKIWKSGECSLNSFKFSLIS